MKKVSVIFCALVAMIFSSCGKEVSFVGTWGVEKIEYESYNTDYAGNPIAGSMLSSTLIYDPYDFNNGLQLVFKADKTGEFRDSDVDTVPYDWNDETHTYESYVVNPDTTLVTEFTYSYDKVESALYMTMKYTRPYPFTKIFMLKVTDLTEDSFVYENEYGQDADNRVYIERSYLRRVSDDSSKSARGGKSQSRPTMPGSLLSGR